MGDSKLFEFINFASRATKIKISLIFVTGSVIVTLTLITLTSLWHFYKGPTEVKAVVEPPRETTSLHIEEASNLYEIKGVSVGFMDKKDTRMAYAQFTLVFNCADEACKKNLLLNQAKLLDTIFEVSSDFYIEDFVQLEATKGFTRLKSKIVEQLDKKFAALAPKTVSIQDWYMK
jgi:hypothetical protein